MVEWKWQKVDPNIFSWLTIDKSCSSAPNETGVFLPLLNLSHQSAPIIISSCTKLRISRYSRVPVPDTPPLARLFSPLPHSALVPLFFSKTLSCPSLPLTFRPSRSIPSFPAGLSSSPG